jgi:hypothetical protein
MPRPPGSAAQGPCTTGCAGIVRKWLPVNHLWNFVVLRVPVRILVLARETASRAATHRHWTGNGPVIGPPGRPAHLSSSRWGSCRPTAGTHRKKSPFSPILDRHVTDRSWDTGPHARGGWRRPRRRTTVPPSAAAHQRRPPGPVPICQDPSAHPMSRCPGSPSGKDPGSLGLRPGLRLSGLGVKGIARPPSAPWSAGASRTPKAKRLALGDLAILLGRSRKQVSTWCFGRGGVMLAERSPDRWPTSLVVDGDRLGKETWNPR